MRENMQEVEKWLGRLKDLLASTKKQENIEFIHNRITLLEWLISKVKETNQFNFPVSEKNAQRNENIGKAEEWLEQMRSLAASTNKSLSIEYIQKRINLMEWLVSIVKDVAQPKILT
ncbi:hypothetical protein [Pseudobacillus badius]|uniref:hypothetical protein n=1 Tax=Bacillus badius TaxID=1455 RepID=UPI003D34C0AA